MYGGCRCSTDAFRGKSCLRVADVGNSSGCWLSEIIRPRSTPVALRVSLRPFES
ncbi:unnamed protein product [Penicillium roqueforti FM164]|uniref:Genomic scaffold, ProqFM164S01 n=1 Tax=Penicillium roqueforti (strain FM164) TaxID=1365484 RepID=W6PQ47_PENRF|nr:unnamed protein product [Penicillium roqueforti FM164]